MADNKPVAVPLAEQLRSIPADAVLRIDTPNALGCMDTRSIPVGLLCHEAADVLSLSPSVSDGGDKGPQAPSIYEQRLRSVLQVVQRYLPPDGISPGEAMGQIVGLVDPWPEGVKVCPECGPVTKCHGVGPGTECPLGVPTPRVLDPNKVQICRVAPLNYDNGQPCACPEGTCSLWKGGLRPASEQTYYCPDCGVMEGNWHMQTCSQHKQPQWLVQRPDGVRAAECTRSHPHENMSPECERLTVKARQENAAARGRKWLCRDCADFAQDGICPNDGRPCSPAGVMVDAVTREDVQFLIDTAAQDYMPTFTRQVLVKIARKLALGVDLPHGGQQK